MKTPVLVAVVAMQLAVPTVATVHGVPSRFGFHMYSGAERLSVTAVDDRGARLSVDVGALVAKVRYELDWTRILPGLVCDELPQARRVVVTSGDRTAGRTC
jgi:hypothetical protein